MAKGRHRLNEASVANATLFTADAGGTLVLYNKSGVTLTGVSSSPSPIEGSRSMQLTYPTAFDGAYITNGLYGYGWVDYFIYMPTACPYIFVDFINHDLDDAGVLFSWTSIHSDGSTHVEFYYGGFGETYIDRAWSPAGTVPKNEWVRVRSYSPGTASRIDVFKGSNLYGTTPDSSISAYDIDLSGYPPLSCGIWMNSANSVNGTYYIDDYMQTDAGEPPARTTAYGPSIRRQLPY